VAYRRPDAAGVASRLGRSALPAPGYSESQGSVEELNDTRRELSGRV